MIKNTMIVLILVAVGIAFYISDFSPSAKACQHIGGRYGLDGCWKVTVTKLSD